MTYIAKELRQDDPLSPFLLYLDMEGFYVENEDAVAAIIIHGVKASVTIVKIVTDN